MNRSRRLSLFLLITLVSLAPSQEDHVFVYVDGANPGPPPGAGTYLNPFHTIADAVHYVFPHDFIIVRPGLYREAVQLPYFVFLRSFDGPDQTVIDASGLPGTHAITMATLCEVTGFTIIKTDGGGILEALPGGASAPAEYGSVIRSNRILGCPAGGVQLSGPCHTAMVENVIADCGAFGIRLEQRASPYFVGNTISGSSIGFWQADAVLPDAQAVFGNSIVFGNVVNVVGLGASRFAHCIVGDVAFAGVNSSMNADPLFVDPLTSDFRLRAGSPCVDAADPLLTPYNSTWDARGYGAWRRYDGDHDGLVRPDIGAYERGGLQVRHLGQGLFSTFEVEIDTGPFTQWLLAAGVMNLNPTIPIPGASLYLCLELQGLQPITTAFQGPTGRTTLTFAVTDPALLESEFAAQVLGVTYGGPTPGYVFTTAERVKIL